jgi:hypothetical protein
MKSLSLSRMRINGTSDFMTCTGDSKRHCWLAVDSEVVDAKQLRGFPGKVGLYIVDARCYGIGIVMALESDV